MIASSRCHKPPQMASSTHGRVNLGADKLLLLAFRQRREGKMEDVRILFFTGRPHLTGIHY